VTQNAFETTFLSSRILLITKGPVEPARDLETWAVAPEVQADWVEILRTAFAQALKDPGFPADAANGNLDIWPTTVNDMESAAADIAGTPQQHLQILRDLLAEHK
jgi:hypothetical protein